ncbi:hypothetical protein ACIQI7_09250 [Kitasatospora sp. NPDC092039]|uniref:hypothetical protein n=1 Tax=Kitasatospora sp. NPDC092039 TaxID=3364086 RepID=UPI003818F842
MKDASGLTYADLAARTVALGNPKGAATLSQAAAGHRLPRLSTAEAFARAAADPGDSNAQRQAVQKISDLWRAAAIGRAALLASEPAPAAEKYQPRRTLEKLALGLRKMRARAGQPTLRTLQDLSEAAGHQVAKSTLHLVLAGRALPTREQLAALLTAFDAAAGPGRSAVRSRRQWMALRDAVESRTRPAPPTRVTGYGCLDGALDEVLERRERKEEILRKVGKLAEDEDRDDYEQGEYRLGATTSRAPWEYMDDDELAAMEEEAWDAARTQQGGRDLLAKLRSQTAGS